MKHLGSKRIFTERLLLRPLYMEDRDFMYKNWASDPEVTRYLSWEPHANLQATEILLEDWTARYRHSKFYQWAIVLRRESMEPIGTIGVNNIIDDKIRSAEVGYVLGKNWWHRGIMREALAAVIQFLFEEVGVNRVNAAHDPRNHRSGEVMKACGMSYEGTLRQAGWNNSGVADEKHYSILKEEYEKKG